MLLKEVYNRGPKLYPDKEAIVDGSRRFTYREWGERHNRLANALLGLGLQKGDVLGVLLKNSAEYLDALAATAKTGIILGGINYRLNTDGIKGVIEDLGCRVLLVHSEYVEIIDAIRSQIPFLKIYVSVGCEKNGMIEYEALLEQYPAIEPEVQTEDDDPDLIVYTSGTTGNPKGCLTARKQTLCRISQLAINIEMTETDRYINVFPIFHVAVNITQAIIFRCGTNVIMRDWDVREFCRLVAEEKITKTTLAPVFINFILNFPGVEKYDLNTIQQVRYGAAPMAPEILKRIARLLPNSDFHQTYGGSETSEVVALTVKDHQEALNGGEAASKRLASCGKQALYHVVRVVNTDGEDVEPGEVGEIIVKGGGVMLRYWRKPEATAEKFKDGWLYTVDLATVDEDGYIYIVDRKNNMIITGGENVYPAKVESVLYEMPEIEEAVILGVPDDKWGEAVKALIVLKAGYTLTQSEVVDFCAQRLANYEKPKSVGFIDALPHLPTGKLDRVTLKKMVL